jgi:two-component system nitrogen regulation response regulator GlnG
MAQLPNNTFDPSGREGCRDELNPPRLIGESGPIRQLRGNIRIFAPAPYPVLIEGESGTGKELVARSLHDAGNPGGVFLPINCAAIPLHLIESVLFGHARGAYTGADHARCGLFEEVAYGTLFLDEIAELPLELQAKLLRVLENGEFRRIGETTLRHCHARILAASNRDLAGEVAAGRFRADLFHRLNVLSLHAPPLRKLGQDKFLLLHHFRQQLIGQTGTPAFVLEPQAHDCLRDYPFPGNVRELRNLVIRLQTRYPGQTLSITQLKSALSHAAADIPTRLPDGRGTCFNLDDALNRQARHYIASALARTQGNITVAARLLGIPRSTLCSRMSALDIVRK